MEARGSDGWGVGEEEGGRVKPSEGYLVRKNRKMEKCKRNCVDANKGKVKFNDMKDHETQWDQGVRKGFGQV